MRRRAHTKEDAEDLTQAFFARFLTVGKGALSYAEAARSLGLNEPAAPVAVHRLRKRYRHLLRETIAQTLADPAQVDQEIRALFSAFGA